MMARTINPLVVSRSNYMPTADQDIMSGHHSCFDTHGGTDAEDIGAERDMTGWNLHGGENQSSMQYTHDVVQGLAHGCDDFASTGWSSDLRAQSIVMESIEK
jgi:hypothetical protein